MPPEKPIRISREIPPTLKLGACDIVYPRTSDIEVSPNGRQAGPICLGCGYTDVDITVDSPEESESFTGTRITRAYGSATGALDMLCDHSEKFHSAHPVATRNADGSYILHNAALVYSQ